MGVSPRFVQCVERLPLRVEVSDEYKFSTDQRAIKVVERTDGDLVDTASVAYLVSGRPDQAVKDLEMALVQYDRAVYHFHLAWAYDLNQLDAKRILAVDELKAAKRLGLTAADLHPIEFEKYQLLLSKYKLPLD